MGKRLAWLPLLPVLAALLALAACGGGGCGAPEPAPGAGGPSAPGAAPAKGGGTVDFSEFDSRQWERQHPQGMQYEAGPSGVAPGRRAALRPPQADWLDPVTSAGWDTSVLRSSAPVLVMASRPDCADCALAGSALKMLEPRVPEFALRRFDASQPEAVSLLPAGLAQAPPPSFALYDGGKVVSQLQGLPFPRAKNEKDADYRVRLYRWFRDALAQKDLKFGHHP